MTETSVSSGDPDHEETLHGRRRGEEGSVAPWTGNDDCHLLSLQKNPFPLDKTKRSKRTKKPNKEIVELKDEPVLSQFYPGS